MRNAIFIAQVEPHPHDMPAALKQKLAPSDSVRSLAIEQEYHRIRKGPQNQDIDNRLDDWKRIYHRAKEYKIAEVTGNRPVGDFLLAIKPIHPDYASVRLTSLPNALDMFDMVENFRLIMRWGKG